MIGSIGLLGRHGWGRKLLIWFYCGAFLLGFAAFGRGFDQQVMTAPPLLAWSWVLLVGRAALSTWFVVSYLSDDWVKLAMRRGRGGLAEGREPR